MHLKRLLIVPAALLLAGGAGIHMVHANPAPTSSPSALVDTGTQDVQSGDQTAPDPAGAASTESSAPEAADTAQEANTPDAPGGPNDQSGDQTGADTGASASGN